MLRPGPDLVLAETSSASPQLFPGGGVTSRTSLESTATFDEDFDPRDAFAEVLHVIAQCPDLGAHLPAVLAELAVQRLPVELAV